ncbi:hypothetical protein GGTG_03939 [Gaeumannomyces tritici R3-111a-1]|uniref:Rab-GAP TBC domain-containing protein n=1 Tax=Gaeumannomyces tritici (strain R3-111a-1) TaxID=644352 RepID=J3NRN9_GAET3|nr:hypothetical protein GGTG_03939 [Gaeumannomyces tritici R3-111a-1]EJT78845.1 hypothetical protein GGTG_03939 [Gaeumannomyces tritici R3-111a-1]
MGVVYLTELHLSFYSPHTSVGSCSPRNHPPLHQNPTSTVKYLKKHPRTTMRPLDETRGRWQETVKHSAGFTELQRAVKFNGSESPCIAGCRSVCWKAFLLFQAVPASDWSQALLASRNSYSSLRDRQLLYIKHPEKLAELPLDPLADVPGSPWDAFRHDELVRAEILQDVRRLPDEPSFYHEPATQTLILDVLFLYCKTHPEAGGYRQGMHELLAPIVYVVHQDAIDRAAASADGLTDPAMVEMLDSYFVEHDSFVLFSAVMANATAFYEISGSPSDSASPAGSGGQSAIVERSRQIHEVTLRSVDPELATHLKALEILPQIFLIRWIRLLFGREFPFEQQLVLWDTMFAFDPSLELIDLVCIAMLIRIRWTLLEMDYSSALQTLLKYPPPQPTHGPHTFVDDAIYLKEHLNQAGGATLVMKYTGRSPPTPPASTAGSGSRPSTPNVVAAGFAGLRPRSLGARPSPLSFTSSPPSAAARFVQQQGSVEALFQGAAKNFLERGERLGLNQAVRDAVGEIRRNVQQGIQEARKAAAASGSSRSPGVISPVSGETRASVMTRRNRQLATMLDSAVTELRQLATECSALGDEAARGAHKTAIETAAARVQFVQVYLEDSTLQLPDEEPNVTATGEARVVGRQTSLARVVLDTTPVVTSTAAILDAVRDDLETASAEDPKGGTQGQAARTNSPTAVGPPGPKLPPAEAEPAGSASDAGARMDMDIDMDASGLMAAEEDVATAAPPVVASAVASHPPVAVATAGDQRPSAPIPTRSTIAQSSFSWMLEPETPASASSLARPSRGSAFGSVASAPPAQRKQGSVGGGGNGSTGSSRERHAFLFGEVVSGDAAEAGRRRAPTSDEIFGLEPLRKALPRNGPPSQEP